MNDIVERLREKILADAFERRDIVAFDLAFRLLTERQEAADEIERLRALLRKCRESFDDDLIIAIRIDEALGGNKA